MTKEVIEKLDDIFKRHISTLNKVSIDSEKGINMCGSKIKVVNFDKIPREYCRTKTVPLLPASNDALYISETGDWSFIEFKNGGIEKADIYSKLYDSILMMLDMKVIPDLDFCRKKMQYILVYNSSEYSIVQDSAKRKAIYAHINKCAEREEKLFGLDRFENFLCHDTHTYTSDEFNEKFVVPVEGQEKVGLL